MVIGRRHGSLATQIAREKQEERLIEAGLLPPPVALTPGNSYEDLKRREMEGGTVLVGRTTFKEFMEGLHRGYDEELVGGRLLGVDEEDTLLARDLEKDGVFDEPEMQVTAERTTLDDSAPQVAQPVAPGPAPFKNPFLPDSLQFSQLRAPPPPPSRAVTVSPLAHIPPQPPILLLPFTNIVGISLVPRQIWGFFNRRHRAQSGAEYALVLIDGYTRPLLPSSDLDFGLDSERFFPKAFDKRREKIAKEREEYYKTMPKELATARALSRGEREPTKEETKHPPKTEVQLRQERFDKEKRWRAEEKAFEVIKRGSPVFWKDEWRGSLRVYCREEEALPGDNVWS